jgi:hypothetical protein
MTTQLLSDMYLRLDDEVTRRHLASGLVPSAMVNGGGEGGMVYGIWDMQKRGIWNLLALQSGKQAKQRGSTSTHGLFLFALGCAATLEGTRIY